MVLFFVAAFAWAPALVAAQEASDPLERGIAAFREGRYQEAEQAFSQVVDRDPRNAQAHFLLARLYAETPLKDRKRAERALDRALEIEPDNLAFLVGRLQQLREEASNFFAERIREAKRAELAQRILRLDSTNAFAHEEMGVTNIRDFWRYRNAVMLPTLRLAGGAISSGHSNAMTVRGTEQRDMFGPVGDQRADIVSGAASDPSASYFDPDRVFQADQFDLELLEQQGVPVLDLSRRAQRAYEKAIGHLKKSLESDPRRRSVYDEMMEIYALKGEYRDAAEMLKEMLAFFPEDPATWRYLGLAQYRLGAMDAAATSFETAFRFMDEEEREAFASLDYLLSDEERRTYEADPVAYAARFWTSKDPRYLTPYNERKLEHYVRLTYADLLYGSSDLGLRGWETQRGRILVRYGVPRVDVVLVPGKTGDTEESVMQDLLSQPGGEALVAQSQGSDPGLARQQLLAMHGSPVDMFDEANTFNVWDYGDFRFVFEDPFRNQEYRLYSPPADQVTKGRNPWLNDYAILARETFRKVPERYAYEAPGRQVEIPYLVTAFKGESEKADLYVHYGIPITQMPPADASMINVTVNVGAFLINDRRELLVEERRTIYGLQTERIVPFSDVRLWVDSQQMSAPPGAHQVSMEFETASGGTVAVQRRDVTVPDFSADRLAISDVLLAYHVEDSPDGRPARDADVVRRGLSITPAPWSVFSQTQPIYLYFEVYHLARDAQGRTDYEVEALLVPKDRSKGIARLVKGIFGGDKGVAVRLPASGTASDDGQYLIMDAADQASGVYTLVLRVHDNISGRTVEKDQDLFLE